ncbi:FkbH [Thraustotheca clavata]|uniref:FkbH n=1 Tax=Thraustotheca clavata TaxID=74557 RepID=A0A1V9YRV6_9STRA|nr:FkbH [Thraustotheca clavata]
MSVTALIGATFAYDAVNASLSYLFDHALSSVTAELQWMPYGNWRKVLSSVHPLRTHQAVTIMLLRSVDLQFDHPELYNATERSNSRLDECIKLFDQYQKLNSNRTLIVILCPSPPDDQESVLDDEYLCQKLPKAVSLISNTTKLYQVANYYSQTKDMAMHSPYTDVFNDVLAVVAARQICRVFRTIKKVFVLDCDNTLWSGAIAEVGIEGIQITPAHQAFQQFLIHQNEKGILLCLCSKNITQDVHTVFEKHPDMLLSLEKHIVLERINHEPKSKNIQEMANELGLGLNSFVFFDDNIVECIHVQKQCPSVTVIQIPLIPQLNLQFADTLWAIDPSFSAAKTVTTEDSQRTKMYKKQLQVRKEVSNDVLASLGMHIDIKVVNQCTSDAILDRIIQLCQRTNQFNLRTSDSRQWCTKEKIHEYIEQPQNSILYTFVTDRFGHYGLVGVAAWSDNIFVDISLFLLSCRVLNRNVEHAMLQYIADHSSTHKVQLVLESTIRNVPIKTFLNQLVVSALGSQSFKMMSQTTFEFHRNSLCNIYQDSPALISTTTIAKTREKSNSEKGIANFPNYESVESFFAPLHKQASELVDSESMNLAKFRRQQREALKQKIVSDMPIWTTNNITERKSCSQPNCKQEIPLSTQCSFKRCRTCCYQVQKSMHRAFHSQHPKAKEAAMKYLHLSGILIDENEQYCQMHANPRRTGKANSP